MRALHEIVEPAFVWAEGGWKREREAEIGVDFLT